MSFKVKVKTQIILSGQEVVNDRSEFGMFTVLESAIGSHVNPLFTRLSIINLSLAHCID